MRSINFLLTYFTCAPAVFTGREHGRPTHTGVILDTRVRRPCSRAPIPVNTARVDRLCSLVHTDFFGNPRMCRALVFGMRPQALSVSVRIIPTRRLLDLLLHSYIVWRDNKNGP